MFNICALVGRVGNDPEIRVTQSGKRMCRLSLATNSFYGGKSNTDWHTVICFDGYADNVEKYIRKGSVIAVLGRIQYSKYKDKNGIERTATSIVSMQIQFVSTKNADLTANVQTSEPQTYSDGTLVVPTPSQKANEPMFGDEFVPGSNDEIPF